MTHNDANVLYIHNLPIYFAILLKYLLTRAADNASMIAGGTMKRQKGIWFVKISGQWIIAGTLRAALCATSARLGTLPSSR
jgi:hypothetical protein